MNVNEILGAFALVKDPVVLTKEELADVQKAIKELQIEIARFQAGYYCKPNEMNVHDLYSSLSKELSFDKMITLYILIKHKIEFLDDEAYMYNEMVCEED